MKKRRMPPALKAYWSKHRRPSGKRSFPQRAKARRSVGPKRRVMARNRRTRRSGGGGGFGRKIGGFTPLLSGVAENVVNNYTMGINGVGTTAVGFLMKDQFSKNLGLYQIGYSIGNFIPMIGGGGSNSGGMV